MRREQDLHANSILHSLEKKKVLTGLFLKVHQCNCVHYWLYFRKSHTSPSSQITSSLAVSSSLILVLFNPFRKLLLFLFFGKSPSHPFSSVSRLLAGAAVSPSLSASRTGGGYANSTLSFLNWLIEARMLWRPCLCAALSLFLLLSLSHTNTHTHTKLAFLFHLHREDASPEKSLSVIWSKNENHRINDCSRCQKQQPFS